MNVLTGSVLVNNSLVRAVSTADAGLFYRATQVRLENSEVELFWPAKSGNDAQIPERQDITPLAKTLAEVSIQNCNLVFRCGGRCSLTILDRTTAEVQGTVVNASQQYAAGQENIYFYAQNVHNSIINAPRFTVQISDLSDECSYVLSNSDLSCDSSSTNCRGFKRVDEVQKYYTNKMNDQVSDQEFCPLMHKFELYLAVNLSYRGTQQCVTFECAD